MSYAYTKPPEPVKTRANFTATILPLALRFVLVGDLLVLRLCPGSEGFPLDAPRAEGFEKYLTRGWLCRCSRLAISRAHVATVLKMSEGVVAPLKLLTVATLTPMLEPSETAPNTASHLAEMSTAFMVMTEP